MYIIENKRTRGIVLSYISIALNTAANFIITPQLIVWLGDTSYAMYQLICATFISLAIVDIGIQTLTIRYISICRAKGGGAAEQQNVLAHLLCIVLAVALIIFSGGAYLVRNIATIYPQYSTLQNISISTALAVLMLFTVVALVIFRFFDGIICAYGHFIVSSALKIVQILARFLIIIVVTYNTRSVLAPAMADLIAAFIMLAVACWFVFFYIKVQMKFHYLNRPLLREILPFGASIIIGNVLAIINGKIDVMLLGWIGSLEHVKNYVVSEQIFHVFTLLGDNFALYFAPQAAVLIAQKATTTEIGDFAIPPTRCIFLICTTILFGFILLGQQFIEIWLGQPNISVWITVIIVMCANTLPVIQGIFNKLMLAKLANKVCTLIMFFISLCNLMLTISLIKTIGYYGAPIGTAVSLFVGWGFFMPFYFQRVLKINMLLCFRKIVKGIVTTGIISTLITAFIFLKIPNSTLSFIAEGIFFVCVTGVTFYIWGATPQEKQLVKKIIFRR